MEKIKEQIETRIYWIRVDKKKSVVLAKGNSKNDTKKIVKELAKKDNSLDNAIIYRISINFHNEKKNYNSGVISFHFNTFKIVKNKLKKYPIEGKEGYLWFEEDWILKNGWSKKYISSAVNLLKKNKGKIVIPGINYYYLLGKN